MTESKHWSREDISRMWTQANGELTSFANHLTRTGASLTGAQIHMALQLANERAEQLRLEPSSQVKALLTKWKERLQPQREESDPPEEFIVDLMEDFIKDLESL